MFERLMRGKGGGYYRKRLFSNGNQRIDWENRNCCNCSKATWDTPWHILKANKQSFCQIQEAISVAGFTDGTFSNEIVERMGANDLLDPLAYTWDCPERNSELPGREA